MSVYVTSLLASLILSYTATGSVIHNSPPQEGCTILSVEGSQHQFQKEGLFRQMEGQDCSGKPMYQQTWPFQENYLFFLESAGAWIIGPRACEDIGGIFLNDSSALTPYGASVTHWREHHSDAWNINPAIRVSCEANPVCDVVTLSGSTYQPRKEGIFARITNDNVMCGGRQVYKQVWLNPEHYLYYFPAMGARWLVGPNICTSHAGIMVHDGALSPDRIQARWTEFLTTTENPGGEWRNATISASCTGTRICQHITISGSNHQDDKEGVYVMMNIGEHQCSDKPIWRQASPTTSNYLFYMWRHRAWVVGPQPCSTFGGVLVQQSTLSPDRVTDPWKEFSMITGGWITNPSISFSCTGAAEQDWLPVTITPNTTLPTATTTTSTTITTTTVGTTTTTSAPTVDNDDVPELVFTMVPEDHSVAIGSIVILECAVNDPNAHFSWYFNDDPMSGSGGSPAGMEVTGGSLLLISVERVHTGTYICEAENDLYTIEAEATVHLDTSDCGVNFQQRPTSGSVQMGASHIFRCKASNAERIEWRKRLHDGSEQRLVSSDRIRISQSLGILAIYRTCISDEGEYVCLAHKRDEPCVQEETASLTVWHVCGQPTIAQPAERQPEETAGYIVGGSDSTRGATPWMAMLFENQAEMFCGGVLINKRWVVTAAHCIQEFPRRLERPLLLSNMAVKLGKRNSRVTETEEEAVGVRRIIIHPDFDIDSYDNDIALLELVADVTYNDYIQPVCLSRISFQEAHGFFNADALGTLTGWGELTDNGERPVNLQEIQLPMQTTSTCEASTDSPVTDGMLCAGYSQAVLGDACKGDSGGPYVMKDQNRWHLVGLVSWGEGCALPGNYGFYTRAAYYYNWMVDQMQQTCD